MPAGTEPNDFKFTGKDLGHFDGGLVAFAPGAEEECFVKTTR